MGVTIREIWEALEKEEMQVSIVAGTSGLDRELIVQEINRPGLALAGFYEKFASRRIQIFGQGESSFLASMTEEQLLQSAKRFFSFDLNSLFFTHGQKPPDIFFHYADQKRIPIFTAKEPTNEALKILVSVLEEKFAPTATMHGVLIEVFGVGVVLQGDSGIGKSETALELVERGHRLVADDLIVIKSYQQHKLVGFGSTDLRHYMEIRGLGLINIKELFGAGAVRDSKSIDMLVTLEEWDVKADYDRLGIEEPTKNILNALVHEVLVPVKPGRNIPIIIETAAMDHRLRKMGYNSAQVASELVLSSIMKQKVQN